MKLDRKTIYAQSSDIKSRTYLEYRKDMKKKAIVELEVLEWLENKLKELYKTSQVRVYKSGGDKFLWFLRKGGVSREPDFVAYINGKEIKFEFQYAEKSDLKFYDFKVSKVATKKKGKYEPKKDVFFVYIHKPSMKYAMFSTEWIVENGEYGRAEAWRSDTFRVPKDKFEKILESDNTLNSICQIIDIKRFILDFQHALIDINKDKLSHLLQSAIDENKIIEIIPEDLDSFFKVCFILDNLDRVPQKANLWLSYILNYINDGILLEDISKIVYCIDFLYSKIEIGQLRENELNLLIKKVKELIMMIDRFYQDDGSYRSSLTQNPLDETRYALFSINLLEDLIQDIIYYYKVSETVLQPINKIYEHVRDVEKTYRFIIEAKAKQK